MEEKLKEAKRLYELANDDQKHVLETLFPELSKLRESEYERIRKNIISWLKNIEGQTIPINDYNSAIDWLEKQGEQETLCDKCRKEHPSHSCQDITALGRCAVEYEQKHADKVEPKFNVGDKIRIKTPSSFDKDMQVARIEKDYYICNHIGQFSSEVVPFSKESSYELIEQSPAWSEEDEEMLKMAIKSCEQCGNGYAYYWLKSLKHRVQPKVELTQLDKNILEAAIAFVEHNNHFNCWRGVDKHTVLSALHSLRPQNRWKPSDEQIKVCKEVYADLLSAKGFDIGTVNSELNRLEEALKKLREE